MSNPISQPGSLFAPCGEWGCGSHGQCINNMCQCRDGWVGVSCNIAPTPPDVQQGDAACGNWGVFGKLTMGTTGYAPACDCSSTGGMHGAACELECSADDDCLNGGRCDTSVGRCRCNTTCYSDGDCTLPGSVCTNNVCSGEWTGVRCQNPRSNTCRNSADCNDNECNGGICACGPDYMGLRCETMRAGTGDPCNIDTDCRGAADTCTVDGVCGMSTEQCGTDADCVQTCRSGRCAANGAPPEISDADLVSQLLALVDYMLTPEGIAQMLAEEGIEEVGGWLATNLSNSARAAAQKAISRGIGRGSSAATLKAATLSATKRSVAQVAKASARSAISKGAKIMSSAGRSAVSWLFVVLQIAGMALDIDDSAGFNAQLPRDAINLYMEKILLAFNEIDAVREAGVQFPREYRPDDTTEWQLYHNGVTADARRTALVEDYLSKLVVNSNGERIVPAWRDTVYAATTAAALPTAASETHAALKTYWWAVLIGAIVVVSALGIGLGLGLRSRSKSKSTSTSTSTSKSKSA